MGATLTQPAVLQTLKASGLQQIRIGLHSSQSDAHDWVVAYPVQPSVLDVPSDAQRDRSKRPCTGRADPPHNRASTGNRGTASTIGG